MAFVDELKVHIEAGSGGNGVVRWLHEKGKEFMGPAGGNGGKGGSVYVRGVSDLSKLAHYRHKKDYSAEKGGEGQSRSMYGKDGEDLVLDVPVGTLVTNLNNGKTYDVKEVGEKILILKGGRGGLGNEHFKASTNIAPEESTPGKPGEEAEFMIELMISAAASFIGLPNAGKSSLLNVLTRADAKVGEYQFTTLEPNLGALFEFILADIPGLIAGASDGKGLGIKFLRHIKRTKVLFHCLSLENENMIETYDTIRKELEAFDPEVAKKPEYIIFTKTDALPKAVADKKITDFISEKNTKHYFEVSVYDDESIKKLNDGILKVLRN
ncbi:MAG: GTPase ObgE [Candidatus Paceibacterota bacterium]|jgi:GTP-binding protein